jgi:hypothetical protein
MSLAPVLVGDSEYDGVSDRGMFQKDVLNLSGSDVLAATDDGVVGAPFDE